MTSAEFLARLRKGLAGLPAAEIEEILADYGTYFADGASAGRDAATIAEGLGDPSRLARELKAASRLQSWQEKRSPGSLIGVALAVVGLATVDLLVLLPVLFFLSLGLMVAMVVDFAMAVAGLAVLLAFFGTLFSGIHLAALTGFAALGLITGSIALGAVILLVAGWSGALLTHYGRLHFRLIRPVEA